MVSPSPQTAIGGRGTITSIEASAKDCSTGGQVNSFFARVGEAANEEISRIPKIAVLSGSLHMVLS